MARRVVVITALMLVLAAPLAWAADMEGKVQSIDVNERSLTLDNGTKIWLADTVSLETLKEDAEITVSYEVQDGKPVATSVETK